MGPGHDPDALHAAVETGDLDQIRSLVESGAETDARDLMDQNETPAHVCARMGNVEALEILLAHGAHVAPRDGQSVTPLLIAAANGHAEVVETLLRYGANPDQSGPLGFRGLHAAIFCGHARSVNLLLEAGADVEKRLSGLIKPLHLAVWSGRVEIVRMLLDRGANPRSRLLFITPERLAKAQGSPRIADLLRTRSHRGGRVDSAPPGRHGGAPRRSNAAPRGGVKRIRLRRGPVGSP